MNPNLLIPTPDAIPVHYGWFQALLLITFSLHLIFMNIMVGTSIMACWYGFKKEKKGFTIETDMGKSLPFVVAFTINSGIAPFLFIQVLYGQFIYTSSILMAVFWFSVITLLLIAYYLIYIYSFNVKQKKASRIVFIGTATILLLSIAFIFSNNMTLMLQPEKWTAYFQNSKGTILNISDISLYPRYLHFIMASVAMGGLFTVMFHTLRKKGDENIRQASIEKGFLWFRQATIIQFIIGPVFFFTLPGDIRSLFLGKDLMAMLILIAAITFAAFSYHSAQKKRAYGTLLGTIITIFLMVVVRDIVRKAYLNPYFKISDLVVSPQYMPLFIFLAVFVIGIAVIIYMFRLLNSKSEGY